MVTQLRDMLGQNAGYKKLAIADKRCLHEQPAMLSIYMAVAQSHYKKRSTLLLKKLS
ncbi:hypothetical protein ACMYR3_03020 [Ampullimonas aquatilis]|uniref:hypothetical protein n=1 Tax=Ampullimonas aquatilis TaxID=1341549 RepID=UPI003C7509C8